MVFQNARHVTIYTCIVCTGVECDD